MTRTIRIDDDVYEGLKRLADPFEDTPNTVIRKLLNNNGNSLLSRKEKEKILSSDKRTKNAKKKLTPQPLYEDWLLYILWSKFGGSATKMDATKATIEEMKQRNILTNDDFEKVSTGESKAENTIAWGRNSLKEDGYIRSDSQRGLWELTQEGVNKAKTINL